MPEGLRGPSQRRIRSQAVTGQIQKKSIIPNGCGWHGPAKRSLRHPGPRLPRESRQPDETGDPLPRSAWGHGAISHSFGTCLTLILPVGGGSGVTGSAGRGDRRGMGCCGTTARAAWPVGSGDAVAGDVDLAGNWLRLVIEVLQHRVERDAAAGDVTGRRSRRRAAAFERRGEDAATSAFSVKVMA